MTAGYAIDRLARAMKDRQVYPAQPCRFRPTIVKNYCFETDLFLDMFDPNISVTMVGGRLGSPGSGVGSKRKPAALTALSSWTQEG